MQVQKYVVAPNKKPCRENFREIVKNHVGAPIKAQKQQTLKTIKTF